MEFRPCIDIHNGKVKQIVGDSLRDQNNHCSENFVSDKDAIYFAQLYREKQLKGGHVILLNNQESEYFEQTKDQALNALREYPGGLQIGGGINSRNAEDFLKVGASHVIVTSYLFEGATLLRDRMKEMRDSVGRDQLVFDLSCRREQDQYYIVTNRWQTMTSETISKELLEELSEYCSEFLIHAVDVEGKANGIEEQVATLLSEYEGNAVTYAGGIHSLEDLEVLHRIGRNRVHATIGSALDLFGGTIPFEEVVAYCRELKE